MKLRQYQKDAVSIGREVLKEWKGFYIADETGLGKSPEALFLIESLACEKGLFLIICPAGLKAKWKDEIRLALPEIRNYTIIVKSYEDLRNETTVRYLTKHKYRAIVLDEAHYIKEQDSQRSIVLSGYPGRSTKPLLSRAEKSIWLSATPMPNRVGELYPFLKHIGHPVIKNRTREEFIMQWAESYKITPYGLSHKGCNDFDAFAAALGPVMIRREKDDVLKDLPPFSREYIDVPTSKAFANEEKKLFRGLLEKAGLPRAEMEVILSNPELLKQLQEAVPGFTEYSDFRKKIGFLKIKEVLRYLKEFVLNEHSKIAVVCYHRDTAAAYADALSKFSPVLVTGEDDTRKRYDILKDVDKRESCILIATLHSIKEGFNLNGFDYIYITEMEWTHYLFEQVEGRFRRFGKSKDRPVWYYYFILQSGLEKYMYNLVNEKAATVGEVMKRVSASTRKGKKTSKATPAKKAKK
jgi:superfamily II DNA or RNA helicase